jgi:aminopeptidase N
MPRTIIAFLIILASCVSVAQGQQKSYDYRNLSQEDIDSLKAAHHKFYTAESADRERAIKAQLLDRGTLADGNQADYDVRYYGITVKLNFTNGTIQANVRYKIRSGIAALNEVDLNLNDQLVVDSVRFGTAAAVFTHTADMLKITTPTPYTQNVEFDMAVYYHGTPATEGTQGMIFGQVDGYTMCYTNCEPFGSRNWWPCKDYPFDKPDSVDIYIDYPSTYKVASNGVIVSDASSGSGRKLVHYKHNYPIATYLVAFTCADFVFGQQTWTYGSISMPVVIYTLPNGYWAKNSFETWMLPVLTHLSDKFGTYPFATEKAGAAQFGWGGAMEHQTCVFYLPSFYDDWVIAHENGHQWWGDMITCKTFNHIWLNEGFASYAEAVFFEADDNNSLTTYLNYMQTQKYLGAGTVYVENLETDPIFDNNLSYDKGSWIVHMLRGVLGDTTFFRVIHDYYNSQYKFGSLTTEDFSDFVSSRVGRDMYWFFHEWVYGDGHPDYEITWQCQRDTSSTGGFNLYYVIVQTQTGGTFFKMPMKTQFVKTGGTLDTTIWNEGQTQLLTLHFADSVTNIVVDPQQWILRTVTTVPFGMRAVTTIPPTGAVGSPYYWKLEAIGGVTPYHWTHLGGDLPYGLVFNGDTVGTVTGTPTYATTFYYNIQVTDSDSPSKSQTVDLTHVINKAVAQPICGDANADNHIDITDAVYLVTYIFGGGPAPTPTIRGDANCDYSIDIADAVFLVSYIFSGGSAPHCP